MDPRAVGFFDSGLGGLSVLRSAVRLLPGENYLYYGDNGNAPYGDRTEAEITRLTLRAAEGLVSHGVKAIVIACNTATGACIREIRETLAVPVVSVEPAIKPACEQPGDGKVLMLATRATTQLRRYLALQARMPDPARVVNVACPGIVDRIERGIFAEDAFDDLLSGYFAPYQNETVDAIVLGCTHYVFIRDAIARYARLHLSGACTLYDGGDATARQLRHVLGEHGLVNGAGTAKVEFLTSGDRARLLPLFETLLYRGGS